MNHKMICKTCKKQFTGKTEQSIGGDAASFQIVNGEELVIGLCDKHQWDDVAKMNKFFNRMYGWA